MKNIHLVHNVLVKAIIITALINFYMFSIMPDGSETYSSPVTSNKNEGSSVESSVIHEYDETAKKSWVCVRRVPDETEIEPAHGRRLNIRGNSNRVHGGFHTDNHEEIMHYGEKHYDSKAHIMKAHLERSNTYEQKENANNEEPNDHDTGLIRRIHDKFDHNDAKSNTRVNYGKCKMYSCINKNGVFVETNSSDTNQGYAGHFVHKEENIATQIMRTPGGKSWASGCVVSPKYKFIYVHVLKSGGTATKGEMAS